jgi:hypothetical protein
MKALLILLIFIASSVASGQTIEKWVDKNGEVHYGDKNAAKNIEGAKTLDIKDTVDPKAYEEGIERNKETEKFLQKQERENQDEVNQPASSPPMNVTTESSPVGVRPETRRAVTPGPVKRPGPAHQPAGRHR